LLAENITELVLVVAELIHTTTGSSLALLGDDSLAIMFDDSLTTLVTDVSTTVVDCGVQAIVLTLSWGDFVAFY